MTNIETLKMILEQIENRFIHLEPQEQADFLEQLSKNMTAMLDNIE